MNVSKSDDPSDLSTDKVLEQARMALAEIQALHLIAHALIGFEDVTELLQAVIDSVVNVLAADRVALITFDLQARQVVRFMKGGASIDEIVEIPFEELWGGLVGLVIREGKPVLSPKGTLDPRASLETQRRRVETNAGSIVIVPIRYQDTILGILSAVNRPNERDFNEWDVELMVMMASQCAIAIENTRLYSELHNTNAELERRVTERTAELSAANTRLQAEIVEHQQSAQALRASEERYRIVVENMSDGLTMIDENDRFAYVSQRFCDLSGYTAEELVGQPITMLTLHQETLDTHLARRRQGEHSLYQLDWRRKDGRSLSTLVSGTPLFDDQGEFRGAFAVVTDITERITMEEQRRADETRFRAFVDHATDALFFHEWGTILDVNLQACESLGYSREELIGMNPHDFDVDLDQAFMDQIEARLNAGEVMTFETRHRRKDGTSFPVEVRVRGFVQGESRFAVSVARDITERKDAEAGLQRYNQRLSILHKIDKGILSAQSPQEVAETVLEQLAQLISCEFLSVILHNDDLTEERIFALRHTPELGQYSQEIQPVVQNEVLETLKSGKTAVAPDLLQQAGSHARLALELESRGIRSALASPMIVHGKLIGTIALAALEVGFFTSEHQQITEEVAAQIAIALHQAKLNDQIRQYNTQLEQRVRERTMQLENANRELELFSYSVSHDLRAPLRAIQGFAEIIARRHRASLNEEGRRYFDHIVTASEQMNQLIIDLLDYARLGRQRLRLERVSVATLLMEVIENLETHIDEMGAQIHLADALADVLGDPPLLKRIFVNLLQNALIYHQSGLPPVIDITCTLEPGYAVVQVTDNGIGIPEGFREKIFNIFQRLHSQDEYPGTGIGLAIVRRSVELLNGSVWVDPLTQVGSTFCVRLPLPDSIT